MTNNKNIFQMWKFFPMWKGPSIDKRIFCVGRCFQIQREKKCWLGFDFLSSLYLRNKVDGFIWAQT